MQQRAPAVPTAGGFRRLARKAFLVQGCSFPLIGLDSAEFSLASTGEARDLDRGSCRPDGCTEGSAVRGRVAGSPTLSISFGKAEFVSELFIKIQSGPWLAACCVFYVQFSS